MSFTPDEPVITSYAKAPARTITAAGTTYAYRELGPKGGIPVIFFVHLAATLDNWDPRIIDPIAKTRHVIAFDNKGVGGSSGKVPDSVEAMADDAYAFIKALGFDQIDIFSFSLGGMVAQDLVVKHPDLVRRLVLTGTGPRGGKDIDKVAGTTYWDILRATLTRSDPKEFLFFNRNATGKPAAKAFVKRLEERTEDRDAKIKTQAFQTQLKAIKKYGRRHPVGPVEADPADAHRQRRQRPHGAVSPLRGPAPPHRGIRAGHLPRLRPRRDLPVPRAVRSGRGRVPQPLTLATEGAIMSTSPTTPKARKQLSSAILLWVRNDQPRQTGMDYWKGPHSGIISANPGLKEYRQIHLAEDNPGPMADDPASRDRHPRRPQDRRHRGRHPQVRALHAPGTQAERHGVQGRDQRVPPHPALRRTPEHLPLVRRRRPDEVVGSRGVLYLRRRAGVGAREFRTFVNTQLVSSLAATVR